MAETNTHNSQLNHINHLCNADYTQSAVSTFCHGTRAALFTNTTHNVAQTVGNK